MTPFRIVIRKSFGSWTAEPNAVAHLPVVNMAHGALFLLGGYIALKLQRNMVGEGGSFGLTSAQVNLTRWITSRPRSPRSRSQPWGSPCSRCSCAGTRARTCARP